MKNVLSIDLDYLMSPCINLYNDCIGSEEFREGDFWDNVNKIRNLDKYAEYNKEELVNLITLFVNVITDLPKEKIFFAEEHDMILEMLDGVEGTYNVYNVDHHHDIHYNFQQKSEVDRFDYACIANWVYYLGKHNKINKYYWVKNTNSQDFIEEEKKNLTFPFDDTKYVGDVLGLKDIKFDYVFICRSNDYLPKDFNFLFDLFYEVACSVKKHRFFVWSTPYCKGGKSRVIR